MMKTFKTLLAAVPALLAFTGCSNTEQEAPEAASLKTVRFHAGAADSRTAFAEPVDGVYQTLWTENDRDVLLSLNYGKAEASAVSPSADGSTASFEAAFDASAATAPYTFYAVSPASAARAISPSRNAWSVRIAPEQTPLATSVDEAAQLLVAKSAASAALPDEVDLHFSHLTAYGRITLKNLEIGEAVVRKAELVFSTPVVGEFYWGEDGTLTSNGASHTITLNTDASGDLWFACAPVDVSGATMMLSMMTDRGSATKTITFPEGRKFSSGKVARFSVDMAGIAFLPDGAFTLVTDASQLQAGDKILIVNADGTYALGKQVSAGAAYRDQTSVRVEDGMISDPGKATVLTLGTGSVSGTWTLETGSGYLAAASTRNVLTESATVDMFSSWDIQVSDGVAVVKARQGSSTFIRYNASTSRFTCYSSSTSQGDIAIYRQGGGLSADDPLTESTEYGSYVTVAARTYVKGSDQIVRSYGADGKLVFAILNAAEKEQLVISGFDPSLAKGDAAVVSVAWRKGLNVLLKQRTFHLKVVKEDGSKVWLGDGTGQGFILKK
jgi:hypothetical protein